MPLGSTMGLFSALKDPNNDIPHAIAAFGFGCYAIVAYDKHFRAITHIILYKTPKDYL